MVLSHDARFLHYLTVAAPGSRPLTNGPEPIGGRNGQHPQGRDSGYLPSSAVYCAVWQCRTTGDGVWTDTDPTHGPDSQRFVPYHDAHTVKPAVLQVPCRTDSTAPERTAGEVRVTTLSRSFFPLSSLAPARRALAAAGNGAAGCRCRFRGHGHGHGHVQLTSSSRPAHVSTCLTSTSPP